MTANMITPRGRRIGFKSRALPVLVPEDAFPLLEAVPECGSALAAVHADGEDGAERGFRQIAGHNHTFSHVQGYARPNVDLLDRSCGKRTLHQIVDFVEKFRARELMVEMHARDVQ